MTDLHTEPVAAVTPSRAPRRRTRRALAALFAVAVAVVAIVAAYISNYQPLRTGSFGYSRGRCTKQGTRLTVPGPYSITPTALTCRRVGDEVTWAYSMRNPGPLSIRISRIGDLGYRAPGESEAFYPLAPIDTRAFSARVFMHPPDQEPVPPDPIEKFDDLPAFRAFTMKPESDWIFAFRTHLVKDPCPYGGGTIPGVALTYSVLGLPRHDDVWAPLQVSFGCPKPA
jgi:hypothetical protein